MAEVRRIEAQNGRVMYGLDADKPHGGSGDAVYISSDLHKVYVWNSAAQTWTLALTGT